MIQNSEQFIKSSFIYTFQKFVTQKFNDNEKIEVKHEQHFTIVSRNISKAAPEMSGYKSFRRLR